MFCTKPNTLNSECAKHYPSFICYEKYHFDDTKADASTDLKMINLFRNIYGESKSITKLAQFKCDYWIIINKIDIDFLSKTL